MEVGLIHLMLPQAKIIDVRREPMAACFAMFKQMLANVSVSNDLGDLAQFYTQYTRMMEYWQSVLPGRVHFLNYERLVEDTETEVRRLFAPLCLPFEGKEPALLGNEACGLDGQCRSGPPSDLSRRQGAVAQLRAVARSLKDALSAAEADATAQPHPIGYERGAAFAAMGLYEPPSKSCAPLRRG